MRELRHILIVAAKDLKLFTADRGALFFFIVFPLFFITMMSLVSPQREDPRLELHLASQEREDSLSYEIIAAMRTEDESEPGSGEARIIWEQDYEKAYQAVKEERLEGFLLFPADFTEAILTGHGTSLKVIFDADAANTSAALKGLARMISSRVGSQWVATSTILELLTEQGLSTSFDIPTVGKITQEMLEAQGSSAVEDFIGLRTEKIGEIEAKSSSNWVIPGYLVMFVFFGAAVAAEAIVRERKNHTLERLLASSARRESILGGIFAGIATKGLIQILIFWTVGILVFNVDLGLSPVGVIILSILMVIMSSAYGVMLATLVKTERGAGSAAVLGSLVMAPLGGCWWPLFIMPRWLQVVARVTPHAWAISGFNKLMLFGASFGAALPEMLVLIGFAGVFGIIAIYRFRTGAT